MSVLGDNLIFLISQPRGGSTLLQRILASHGDVHSVSEPWLMLHPIYALRSEGYQAEYGEGFAQPALNKFLQELSGGKEEYYEGLRRMYTYLYERALETSGKKYFLDKTPRYFFVIPELYQIFPKAHYIILLRNPLAVMASTLNTWVGTNWISFYHHKPDLIYAPNLLLKGIKVLGEQATVIQYEDLVKSPETEIKRICDKLEIPYATEMIEYGRSDLPHWQYGDQEDLYKHTEPVSQNIEKWVSGLRVPQVWRLSSDLLNYLGKEIIEQMGYSYQELTETLETTKPSPHRLWFTFSLSWLLEKKQEERRAWERSMLRLIGSLQRKGLSGVAKVAFKKLFSAPSMNSFVF
jgi:hypothetical protein